MTPDQLRRRISKLSERQPLTIRLEKSLATADPFRRPPWYRSQKSIGLAGFVSTTVPATTVGATGGGQPSSSTIMLYARRWCCGWERALAYPVASWQPQPMPPWQPDRFREVAQRALDVSSRGR